MMVATVLLAALAVAQPSPSPGTAMTPKPTTTMTASPAPAGSAQPTVRRPLGPAAAPVPGSQASGPAIAPGDSGNGFTASGPLGPQRNPGKAVPHYLHYVAADAIAPPLVYNEFSPGNKGSNGRSYAARAAVEFPLANIGLMAGVDGRRYVYPTNGSIVSGIAGTGRFFFPAQSLSESDIDGRVAVKLIDPRIYAGVSYLSVNNNYTFPRLRGIGYGIEKLPDLDQNFSLHGSAFYYPNVGGNYTVTGAGSGQRTLSYRVLKYAFGASFQLQHTPLFVDAGYLGDRGRPRTNAPIQYQHQGPYAGFGLHF
ncbi:MAG: hypothetical protein ABR508_11955 [Candidatus Baltobacteraceae bacterium]